MKSRDRALIGVSAGSVGVGASLGFFPGFLATVLSEDLGVSKGKVGLIVGIYFGATGIGSILAGKITELYGPRKVIFADMLAVATCSFLIAILGNYAMWVISSLVAGAAYGLTNTGTNAAIGKAIPEVQRTLAMSIKTAGVPFMATVASAIGPWSAGKWQWENILVVNGICALVVGLAALMIVPDDDFELGESLIAKSLPVKFYWFGIASFLLIAGSQPLYSWIVSYLEDSLDVSSGLAGAITSIACFCGVIGMILNGLHADRVGAEKRIQLIMALLTISAIAVGFIILGLVIGVWIVLVGAIIGVTAQLAAIGTMHACVVDKAPFSVSRATGVTMTGYYLGALASPGLFGYVVDWTGSFAYPWAGTAILLLAAVFAWFKAGKIETQLT
ncbi:MAG: hypothetical protein CL455_07065 [Acidimicrobiaceae bacterium]|nr:hypothetical protein [Acidimicrobiaceae bacterium]